MRHSTSLSIAVVAAMLGISSFSAAQYGPAPGYGPPAPGYGPPALGYGPPAPGYGYGPPPGYGAPPPPPSFLPEAMQSRVALQLDWFNSSPSGAGTVNVLTWDLIAQIGLTENIFLDADLPWSYTGVDGVRLSQSLFNVSKAVFGHPFVGAHLAARLSPTSAFFFGLGFGIPVQGTLSEGGYLAASIAGSIRGYQELHRFVPNQFPLRFRGGIEITAKPFYLQADLAPSFLISIDSLQSTVVTLDQGTNAGVRTGFGLLAGLRIQESFFLTTADDRVQTALEPFVGYESPAKSGLTARYGLLMPLDGVEGFAFDKGKLLTHRFSVGAKF